jgi:hypothetical protein
MDGYTRRIRRRSRPRPLSLEILEDRVLLSAMGYAPGGASVSPHASGGEPPAVVSTSPAAGQDQGQKGAERLVSPAGGASQVPASQVPGARPSPAREVNGAVLASPGLAGLALAMPSLHVDTDSRDSGTGLVDLDGDSPFQETLVASLLGANGGVPGGNGAGANDPARDPTPGAMTAPSLVAVQPLNPSSAAMGLQGASLTVAGVSPRPEGVEGVKEETTGPGSRERASTAPEVSPVEPQGDPRTAENDAATLPATPAGHPLAGLLPIDVDTLRRAADAFFARLADLAQEPIAGCPTAGVMPWLGVLGAAACEWVRAWKKPAGVPGSVDGWGPGAALPAEEDA